MSFPAELKPAQLNAARNVLRKPRTQPKAKMKLIIIHYAVCTWKSSKATLAATQQKGKRQGQTA